MSIFILIYFWNLVTGVIHWVEKRYSNSCSRKAETLPGRCCRLQMVSCWTGCISWLRPEFAKQPARAAALTWREKQEDGRNFFPSPGIVCLMSFSVFIRADSSAFPPHFPKAFVMISVFLQGCSTWWGLPDKVGPLWAGFWELSEAELDH